MFKRNSVFEIEKMSQPETSSTPSINRVNTIRLVEHQIENLKELIIDKIRKMFQNFDEEKKENLIKNLPVCVCGDDYLCLFRIF